MNRRRPPFQWLLSITAAILTIGIGLLGYWYYARWQQTSKPPALSDIVLPAAPYTVLFLGTDISYRHEGNRQLAQHSFDGRSDSMMLVHVDPLNKTIGGLNIPRDTMTHIPGYGVQKINSANALGGPGLAARTVTEMLGIPVEHYVVLNVQGLVDAVNEIGGVTLEVPKKMSYMDWTAKLKIDLDPGVHTLTGNQAMGFVRFRHDELGDIGRIQRQQIFMRSFMAKMLQPSSWPHLPQLVAIARQSVVTDMSDAELFKLFNLVRSTPKDKVKFALLPGRFGANGSWVPDEMEAQKVLSRLSGRMTLPTSRNDLTIAIENLSSRPGIERQVSEMLRRIGYSVVVLRKHGQQAPLKQTRIIAQNANIDEAQLLKADLGCGEIINASVGDIYTNMTLVIADDMEPVIKQFTAKLESSTPGAQM